MPWRAPGGRAGESVALGPQRPRKPLLERLLEHERKASKERRHREDHSSWTSVDRPLRSAVVQATG
eukprot:9535913-Alexandrium_andersonii.AAC.1